MAGLIAKQRIERLGMTRIGWLLGSCKDRIFNVLSAERVFKRSLNRVVAVIGLLVANR